MDSHFLQTTLYSATDIASFRLDGPGFEVHKVKEFVNSVLPRHFKMTGLASFQRQLNFYQFTRIVPSSAATFTSDGAGGSGFVGNNSITSIAYFHAKFCKGKPDLLHQIKRAKRDNQSAAAVAAASGRTTTFAGNTETGRSGSVS